MISIPWWLFGTCPDDDVEEKCEEHMDSTLNVECFQTPSLSLTTLEPSEIDVPSYKNFRASLRNRSSLVLEVGGDRRKSTDSTLQRFDTEVMMKLNNGRDVISEEDANFGLDHNTSVDCFGTENGPLSKTDEEYPIKLSHLEEDEQSDDSCSADGDNSRCYPTMFSSFYDTTAIFNTTIRGDIEKIDENSLWLFKELKNSDNGDGIVQFKVPETAEKLESPKIKNPLKRPRKQVINSKKKQSEPSTSSASASNDETLPIENSKSAQKRQKTMKTPRNNSVSVTRRLTPSRNAKTKVVSYYE